MFLVNSRQGRFSAASRGSRRKSSHPYQAPLLPKLRGQFAEFLHERSLERLSILYPPTCVSLRYGHACLSLRGFSWLGFGWLTPRLCPHDAADLPTARTRPGTTSSSRSTTLAPSVPPQVQTAQAWRRNINLLPIGYAFRPRLRHRLTLGGFTFPRKP